MMRAACDRSHTVRSPREMAVESAWGYSRPSLRVMREPDTARHRFSDYKTKNMRWWPWLLPSTSQAVLAFDIFDIWPDITHLFNIWVTNTDSVEPVSEGATSDSSCPDRGQREAVSYTTIPVEI